MPQQKTKKKVTKHYITTANTILLGFNNQDLEIDPTNYTMWPIPKSNHRPPTHTYNFDLIFSAPAELYNIYSSLERGFCEHVHSDIRRSWEDSGYLFGTVSEKEGRSTIASVLYHFGIPHYTPQDREDRTRLNYIDYIFFLIMREGEPFNGFSMPHHAYGKDYNFSFYPVPNEDLPSSMVKQMIDHELPGIMAMILSPFKLIDNF